MDSEHLQPVDRISPCITIPCSVVVTSMAKRYSKSAITTLRTIGSIGRASIKAIVKEAVVEALEETDHDATESTATDQERHHRGLVLGLAMAGILVGMLVWRRKSAEPSEILDEVSKDPYQVSTEETVGRDEEAGIGDAAGEATAEADD